MIKARVGVLLPEERARIIQERLLQVARDSAIDIAQVTIHSSGSDAASLEIVAGQTVIMTVTEGDAQADEVTLAVAAEQRQSAIQAAIRDYRDMRVTRYLLLQAGKAVLLTGLVVWLWLLLRKADDYLRTLLQPAGAARVYVKKIPGRKWIPLEQIYNLFHYSLWAFVWGLKLVVLYFYLSIVLSFFPWTRAYSKQLLTYIMVVLESVSHAVWDYLPKGIAIILIVVISRFLLRLVSFFFTALREGKLKIAGFYPEWASPTYKIVRFLILTIAVISIFPYLPGSHSLAFQGVSVLLGVLLSLGSSSAVANVVAGIALTYTRSFNIGDRVKIGEHIGDIIEKSLLATRIRTVKNEEITIPNASILNSPVVNYSSASKETALILYASVTVNYDVPWQKVHPPLIEAALATPGILQEPRPFVLQRQFNNTTVSYEINAYTQEPHRMVDIYSDLHRHIIEFMQTAGVDIASPQYIAFHHGSASDKEAVKGKTDNH